MSGVSSTSSSITRMTGLSGLDVDSIVTDLMKVEKAKVDKVKQDRQVVVWKQDKYRDITSLLQSFNNTYFNYLNPSQDMRNIATYSAFAFKYDGLDTSSYFSATAGSGMAAGDYTIKNIYTALAAKVTGTSVAGGMTGNALTTLGINAIKSDNDNNKITVTLNGVSKEITIKETPTDIADLRTSLEQGINAAFGSGKVTVGIDVDKLTFSTSNTNTLSIGPSYNGGYSSIFNTDLSAGITPTAQNNKFSITLGSTTKEFALSSGTNYANTDAVVAAIQSLVDDGTTGFGPNAVTVKNVNNQVVLESVDPAQTVSAGKVVNGGLAAIGFSGVNTSNKIDADANLYDISKSFAVPLTVTGNDNDISFSINGQTFNFSSRSTSLNEIISAVNSNTAANATMSYDSLNNKITLQTQNTGVTEVLNASDSTGNFLTSLSLTASGVTGRDASFIFNDGVNGDQLVTRSTNSFTIAGINFQLKKDNPTGSVSMSATADTTKAVDLIKGFVSKYNELLDKINSETTAQRDFKYPPLTDDQKAAMKDEDIKNWEDKAKTGLLSGDDILSSISTNMRNAVLDTEVDGLSLADIGIKTSSWVDRGKLYIDETKLKEALTNNPDKVMELFTQQSSNVTYRDSIDDYSKRTQRYDENGVIYKLSDIIQDNIRTIGDNSGQRGALLEKAGMTGDRSEYNNYLYEQISDYDTKITSLNDMLTQKENDYYSRFSKIEALISQMNSQSSWLSAQTGG